MSVFDIQNTDRTKLLRDLSNIQHRVLIVGRYNGSSTGLYLFTNKDVNQLYGAEGLAERGITRDKLGKLDYYSFVETIRPSASERVTSTRNYFKFPSITFDPGQDGTSNHFVFDLNNYFFLLATADTDQQALTRATPRYTLDANSPPGLSLWRKIREYFRTFTSFQQHTPQLLQAFRVFLHHTCNHNNRILRTYNQTQRLPGANFESRLLNFLYEEDLQKEFFLSDRDFTRWNNNAQTPNGKQVFIDTIRSFRSQLLTPTLEEANNLPRAQNIIQNFDDLAQSFKNAKDAYNNLGQILQSKVQLCIIFDWYFQEIVKKITGAPKIGENGGGVVETAILQEYVLFRLGTPVSRPNSEDRRNFSKTLQQNIQSVSQFLLYGEQNEHFARLEPDVQNFFAHLREDNDRLPAFLALHGLQNAQQQDRSMADLTAQTMSQHIVDIIAPVLWESPTLTKREVLKEFSKETFSLYLTALNLSNAAANDTLLEIAAAHRPTLLEANVQGVVKITEQTQAAFSSGFLRDVFDRILFNNKMMAPVKEGLNALFEMHDFLPFMETDGEIGPAALAAISRQNTAPNLQQQDTAASKIFDAFVKNNMDIVVEKVKQEKTSAYKQTLGLQLAPDGHQPSPQGPAANQQPVPEGQVAKELLSLLQSGMSQNVTQQMANYQPTNQPTDATSDAERKQKFKNYETELETELKRAREEMPSKVQNELYPQQAGQLPTPLQQCQAEFQKTYDKYQEIRQTIFQTYADHLNTQAQQAFRSKTERYMLMNMLLLFQNKFRLGDQYSFLFRFLLDLFQHTTDGVETLTPFIQEKSLTEYIDFEEAKNAWVDPTEADILLELQSALEHMIKESEQNTKVFASHLRGIQYLFDKTKKSSNAEIFFLNATADEFVHWFQEENLNQGSAGTFRADNLGVNTALSLIPSVVYLTELAFDSQTNDIAGFLENVANHPVAENGNCALLPPLVFSSPIPTNAEQNNETVPDLAVARLKTPVYYLSPSPPMNRPAHHFATQLPGGYLLCAHLLGRQENGVHSLRGTNNDTLGRIVSLARNNTPMHTLLNEFLFGSAKSNTFFLADYYLFLLLQLRIVHQHRQSIDAVFPTFTPHLQLATWSDQNDIKALGPALLKGTNGAALGLRTENNHYHVLYSTKGDVLQANDNPRRIHTDTQWFLAALQAIDPAAVPNQPAAPNP